MIFWKSDNFEEDNTLVKYYGVDGFNAVTFLDKNILNEKGKLSKEAKKIVNKCQFIVFSKGICLVKHISAIFKDAVIITELYPKLSLKQVIPVVSREQILSGEELPKSVAVFESDANLIRLLYERGHKITWYVKYLPDSMPHLFFYNFEHLILNPFGHFIVEPDGTFNTYHFYDEFIDMAVRPRFFKIKNKKKVSFMMRTIKYFFFCDNPVKYSSGLERFKDGYHKKFYSSYYSRREVIGWYNILAVYRGLYDFSQQLYGGRNKSRSSTSRKFRNSTDSGGRNEGPDIDSQKAGSGD